MNPSEFDSIALSAAAAFKEGRLVALPTETVYGLAAPIDSPSLLELIFKLKERPLFDPLIVHVNSLAQAQKLVLDWPPVATLLAQKFWPGPLTLVLRRNPDLVSDLITAGLPTVGLRLPRHPLAQAIIAATGVPLAAPSANKFTKTSPTTLSHVRESFSEHDVFMADGGGSEVGLESTIVEVREDESLCILRRGMITSGDLVDLLGTEVAIDFGPSAAEREHQVVAPGMHYIHYRPDWPLVVGTSPLERIEGKQLGEFSGLKFEQRQLASDPLIAARSLYTSLRRPLVEGAQGLYLNISNLDFKDERTLALWDRLQKAASLILGLNS